MRTFRIVAALGLAAGVALASGDYIGGAQVYWSETQAGTRAAPTLVTEGMDLTGLMSAHAVVLCADGSNITAGSMVSYYRSPKQGWMPGPTSMNFALPTGGPKAVGPEGIVTNPFGRWLYATSGVTCSGVTSLTVTIEGNQK